MDRSHDELMSLLGSVVYESQETEKVLHLCMSIAFGLKVAESIDHLKKIYAKKTLGQFLLILRTRIGLKEPFDSYLFDYIERRNFIIHNISRAEMFSLQTEEGRKKLYNFLVDFRVNNRKIKLTFVALTDLWMKHLSPSYKESDALRVHFGTELYNEISEQFVPELRSIFGK